MSAEATEETFAEHKKLKSRADDYIIKPFSADQIMEKISPLTELEKVEGAADDSFESLEDDDSIVIEDLPELDDEPLGLDGDESTVVRDSPIDAMGDAGDDGLESFDEAFDGIQMGDDFCGGFENFEIFHKI